MTPAESGPRRGEDSLASVVDRGPDAGPVEIPVLGSIHLLLRHARLVLLASFLALAAVVALTIAQGRSYTSTASFTPQTRTVQSNLSGLAAQFGFALPAVDASRSPAFYADLVQSRQILTRVVGGRYSVAPDTDSLAKTLVELWTRQGRSLALRQEAAVRRLRRSLSVNLVQRTGVIRVAARANDPALAQQLVRQLLAELNTFNLEARQSQATMERRFTEQRLDQARQELRQAEDRQQLFLQRNREFASSPQLKFEQDRLAREVIMRQQLYTTLSQALEQAKIEEIRDTPVITVVEAPDLPVRPDSQGWVRKGFLALLLGGLVGSAIAFGKEFRPRVNAALQRVASER